MIQIRKLTGTGDGVPVLGVRLEKTYRDWLKKKAKERNIKEPEIVRELIRKAMEEDTADANKSEEKKNSKKGKKP
ncbi:MAG: hypothetical protein AB9903_13255 [Vulcanimicrobiota bacterium]